MLEIRRITAAGVERPAAPEDGCWLHVVAATAADLDAVAAFGVPRSLLDHVDDVEERPRVEHVADCVLVVLQYPSRRADAAESPWETFPISVITTPRGVVTLAHEQVAPLQPMLDGRVAGVSTARPAEFVLHVCWRVADAYLAALRDINARVDRLEHELRRSLRNEEVLGLLEYQKSLNYFAIDMKANERMLERFERLPVIRLSEQDQDLLQDVRIEMRQAIETVEIADSGLSDMMDAFASIVSNNLNSVMKALTSVTIILAVPTLIASVYGMNVGLPGARNPLAFGGIVALSVAACAVLFVVFRRRNWL
jgi:magnesium transporter